MSGIYVKLIVTGTAAHAQAIGGRLVSGMVGVPCEIVFDSGWDGLSPMLICSGGGKSVPMTVSSDGKSEIPSECIKAKTELKIGTLGISENGNIQIPTIWASLGVIPESTKDAKLSYHEPVTPDIVQQIASQAYKAATDAEAAKDVVRRADAGEFNGSDAYSPRISSSRTWEVYDDAAQKYVDTGIPVSGGGGGGVVVPATPTMLGSVMVGSGLKVTDTGVLSVDTTDVAEQDNTQPITSAGVHTVVGNINALLGTI